MIGVSARAQRGGRNPGGCATSRAVSGGVAHFSVTVVIADFSTYLEDALAMFWNEVSGATEAAGARIDFVRVPGELLCLECCESFMCCGKDLRCPECRSEWVKPISGQECYVESIEVKLPEDEMTVKTIQIAQSVLNANREIA